MNELALFAGCGGGILAGCLLGWRTIGAVEIEDYPRRVLLQRQRDGILPKFPIWDDVCSFNGLPWKGHVDIISGGFPCQDISVAGKGAGITGSRSGLWTEMHRIVCEVRPRWVFVENSPMLLTRGIGRVLGDLASTGYDAAWTVLGADDVGAPHVRKRIWILAHDSNADCLSCTKLHGKHQGAAQPFSCRSHGLVARTEMAHSNGSGWHEKQHETGEPRETLGSSSKLQFGRAGCCATPLTNPDLSGCQKQRQPQPASPQNETSQRGCWWSIEPRMGRVVDGVAHRVDRLRALGNGQVPLVAATAFLLLKHHLLSLTNNTTT